MTHHSHSHHHNSAANFTDEAFTAFEDFKRRANEKQTKYIIFKIASNNTSIVVDKEGKVDSIDDLGKALPPKDPRYVVFKHPVPGSEDHQVVLLEWVPHDAAVKERNMYETASGTVRGDLKGVDAVIHADDRAKLERELKRG